MIKVLIVDDSAFMRKAIEIILVKDPELRVVGQARDGQEALDLIPKLEPDVITMDVEMPRMDGITAVGEIMQRFPKPVLMISSVTKEGAEVTLKAMEAGAMDFISKPQSHVSLDIVNLEDEIRAKVKAVARRHPIFHYRRASSAATAAPASPATHPSLSPVIRVPNAAQNPPPKHTTPFPHVYSQADVTPVFRPSSGRPTRDLVAIGVSTGGPPAVQKILMAFPEDFPVPILIAQHMPASFTGAFAARLDTACKISVKEAVSGETLRVGCAYISPGGRHIKLAMVGGNLGVIVTDEPQAALYKPSATVLMESVGLVLGRRALGVQMTGMGSDGLEGVRVLKQKGGAALAQSDATCVVYGMSKAIVDAGLADAVVDLDDMASAIMRHLYC